MIALRRLASAWFSTAAFAVLLAVGWAFLRAQPAPDAERLHAHWPTLGAHTLLGQSEGDGVSPAITPAISTQATGSSLITFVASHAVNDKAPTDSKSNAWKQIGNRVIYRGYESFDVKAYVAVSAKGGSNHTVSVIKPGTEKGELTMPFIEVRNADVLKDVAQNYPPTGSTLTSATVTTTGPATLVAFWWGDGGFKRMEATPGEGFTVIEQFLKLPDNSGVQCAVAYKDVDRAGTYSVTWTNSPVQGAPLWLFAFQSKGATPKGE